MYRPLAKRVINLPKRFRVNIAEYSVEGGEDLLQTLVDRVLARGETLELPVDKETLANIIPYILAAESAYDIVCLNSMVPIDDSSATDPRSIKEAQRSIYWAQWLAAIYEELEALKAKGVYEDVDVLPPGRQAVDCKWVLHIKRDSSGRIARFKARLVARGFTQIPGQDFTYTFAPVARWDSIRILLTIGASRDMELRHIDIKTAFLNGPLTEEIYMKRPDIAGVGFWRLRKGLYGLKQAGRTWYLEFDSKYQLLGFKRCEADWSVHTRSKPPDQSLSATSVDDILLGSSSTKESDDVTAGLKTHFDITDNGPVEHLLGCLVERNRKRGCIMVSQPAYTESILRFFDMEGCNSVQTPLPGNGRLSIDDCPKSDKERDLLKKEQYCTLVGKVMYLATTTRPDIAFAVRELAKFMSNYGHKHVLAAKHLLRYLNGTRSLGITLGNIDQPYPLFRGFTDSDWASGEDRRSISGYVMMIGDSPVAWSSKQQAVVALSSCEAEYLACTHAACQIIWMRQLLGELGFPQKEATVLFCDNNGTIACTHDPHQHTKMKHIDIRAHFIRDCVNNRTIDVIRVPGKENVADIMTKSLQRILHANGLKLLGLHPSQGGVLEEVTRAV